MVRFSRISVFHFAWMTALIGASTLQAEPKAIRVAIFSDAGVAKAGIKQVKDCLLASQGFEVETIDARQIRSGDLKNFDVLIHGGGSASKQGETLGAEGRDA